MVNAVAVLGSAAALATALEVSSDATLAPAGDAAATVQLLYAASGNLWTAGSLFFGLWLIPMGILVTRSRWMPAPLAWILVVGGAGYLLSAFLGYLAPDAGVLVDALAYPATIGELWMIGYLLTYGVRRTAAEP